jgi:hypothetical protein
MVFAQLVFIFDRLEPQGFSRKPLDAGLPDFPGGSPQFNIEQKVIGVILEVKEIPDRHPIDAQDFVSGFNARFGCQGLGLNFQYLQGQSFYTPSGIPDPVKTVFEVLDAFKNGSCHPFLIAGIV